jgi:hypothetical protein
MTIIGLLKTRSLELIEAATSLKDVAYLVKSLSDTGSLDSNISAKIYTKVNLLTASSSSKDIAYILKALENSNDIYDSEIYKIGTPGQIGFGVAVCPEDRLPSGLTGLLGYKDITSANYGNYIDLNGSILVYVPKHYYKYVGNDLSISSQPLTGYVLDRAFINASTEKNGVFVYKYGASNANGVFASKQFQDPLSTNISHNPISGLTGSHANNYGGLYTAVKTAGSDYFLTSVFIYSMLARLAFAHGKAATSTAACAYIDVNPKMPKGNLNNALQDINDSSVKFQSSNYENCALTGSASNLAKTTHNGQDCGIADLCGNMNEVASGFIRTDALGFLILKESVDITTIATDSTTLSAGGAYDTNLYDVVDLSDLIYENNNWIYLGNGSETVFAMNTDRTTAEYKRTSVGIPLASGVSSVGTTEFGNDGIYRYLRNEMACLVGGHWGAPSYAGLACLTLSTYRTTSNTTVGGRASLYAL